MPEYGGWERLEPPLGSGGQGIVYRARCPLRAAECAKDANEFRDLVNRARFLEFADSAWSYARPDLPSEQGALKIFNIRTDRPDSYLQRLHSLGVFCSKFPEQASERGWTP